MKAVDMGGSMYVHTFGAYFGLAASFFFHTEGARRMNQKARTKPIDFLAEGNYTSQLVACLGTIFLFMFWPSFNGALANGF